MFTQFLVPLSLTPAKSSDHSLFYCVCSDSWGSTSGREDTLLQTDPTGWIRKDLEKDQSTRSPEAREDVSSSFPGEPGNNPGDGAQAAAAVTKNPRTTNSKAKSRTAFTESQMNILARKFSVQRYLPPSEMKNLSVLTGLTYKQVRGGVPAESCWLVEQSKTHLFSFVHPPKG